jgi:hypothetical protein
MLARRPDVAMWNVLASRRDHVQESAWIATYFEYRLAL